MNHDDIIRMAREAGATDKTNLGVMQFYVDELERFAELVEAAEREACARVCDEQAQSDALGQAEKYRAMFIADTIRARGEK